MFVKQFTNKLFRNYIGRRFEAIHATIEKSFGIRLEKKDTEFLLDVIGVLARSEGIAQIAGELGVTREALYKSLSSEGNPSFNTMMNVLDNLGFRLKVEQKASA
jgi:probable addiction module antidote protein